MRCHKWPLCVANLASTRAPQTPFDNIRVMLQFPDQLQARPVKWNKT